MAKFSLGAAFLSLVALAYGQHYSATYLPSNAPKQSENGQTGTNQCGTGSNQTSTCQNAYINSVDDFCLFAPPEPGPGSVIGNTERVEVAWCIKSGYGTRLIPDGSITGAHFVKTPDFVQVTGVGDLTKINIPKGDAGGELDPHGADGNGNPIGGLVFSSAFGQLQQLHEWTNFMSDSMFCFRACKEGPKAPQWCQHIYDVMGCMWNMPASYDAGVFERCAGDSGEPMGVYGGSTFFQGQPATPDGHPPPPSSNCDKLTSIGNGLAASPTSTVSSAVSTLSSPATPGSGMASPAASAAQTPSASVLPSSRSDLASGATLSITSAPSTPSSTPSSTGASRTSSGGSTPSNTSGASQNSSATPLVNIGLGAWLAIIITSVFGSFFML